MQEGTAARGKLAPARNAGGAHPPAKPLDKPVEIEYIPVRVSVGPRMAALIKLLAENGDQLERLAAFKLELNVRWPDDIRANISHSIF